MNKKYSNFRDVSSMKYGVESFIIKGKPYSIIYADDKLEANKIKAIQKKKGYKVRVFHL
jgi:hypothetical protein